MYVILIFFCFFCCRNHRISEEKNSLSEYKLEIIDVYQQPLMAEIEQIVALPLLIKKFPLPERRLIGDLSDTNKVLKGLGILSSDL